MNKYNITICLETFPIKGVPIRCVLFGYTNMKSTDWFYKTTAWQECRDSYAKSVGGLCEKCYSKGRIVPGEIVHHKIHLNASNINDPSVTLNWNNLVLLCRDCHGNEHTKHRRRYKVDALGRVTTAPD